jgi:membrane associated rhomboid family serine protease
MSALTRFGMFPPVIKALVIINVSVYIFQIFFINSFSIGNVPLTKYFIDFFYLHPVESESFYFWQLISYQFLHDPSGIMHIFFNLLALWMFGVELEHIWGGQKFITFYLLAGIGAGLTQLFISPLFSSPGLTIGASGSVYGILLAYGMTFPDRPIFMFPFFIPIPAKFFVLIYAGISLIMGITSDGNIAHFAHLGGAATGFLLFKFGDKLGIYNLVAKMFAKKQSYVGQNEYGNVYKMKETGQRHNNPINYSEQKSSEIGKKFVVDDEVVSQEQINIILDKISETGYQNLSDKEKRILFELSQKLK